MVSARDLELWVQQLCCIHLSVITKTHLPRHPSSTSSLFQLIDSPSPISSSKLFRVLGFELILITPSVTRLLSLMHFLARKCIMRDKIRYLVYRLAFPRNHCDRSILVMSQNSWNRLSLLPKFIRSRNPDKILKWLIWQLLTNFQDVFPSSSPSRD